MGHPLRHSLIHFACLGRLAGMGENAVLLDPLRAGATGPAYGWCGLSYYSRGTFGNVFSHTFFSHSSYPYFSSKQTCEKKRSHLSHDRRV